MCFVVKKLQEYVDEINGNLETKLPTRGPVEITFDGDIMNGVTCNLESRGFKALCKATEEIVMQSYISSFQVRPLLGNYRFETNVDVHFFFCRDCTKAKSR
jgi:hypothetical protein